ncbi:MAG: ATP-binding protein [Burkholderiaceae bacterium]
MNERVRRRKRRHTLLIAAGVLVPTLLWASGYWAWHSGQAQLRQQASESLEAHAASLRQQIEKFETLPRLIALEADIGRFLAAAPLARATQADALNRRLEQAARVAGASDIYLMDRQGMTIAASNWRSAQSFLGRNFAFRPYFKQALTGRAGRYFALGTTSNRRGYYYSAPVGDASAVRGVVAVKVSLRALEEDWAARAAKLLVTDADDVIFASGEPRWLFKSLGPLDEATRARIKTSRRYVHTVIEPLPVVARWQSSAGTRMIRLTLDAGRGARRRQVDYAILSQPMADVGWTVHLLSDVSPVRERVVAALLTAGLAAVVVLLAALFVLQRRDHARERQAILQRSTAQLEELVAQRTAELTRTNARLATEVGERQDAERALRDTQDELVQAGKLAALGQMAAEITHELNQPLTAIRAYADNADALITRGNTREARSNLTLIGDLTKRMARITGQLKTFSRKSSGDPSEVQVAQLLDHSLMLIEQRLRRAGVELERDRCAPTLHVLGDALRLQQVLVNLCNNAIDAMLESPRKQLHLSVEADARRVRIRVRDTGPGIDEDALPKLFEPYFTTKEIGRGLGLGLSISYGIIKDHGGSVAARNRKRGGAEFTIELPRVEAATEKKA